MFLIMVRLSLSGRRRTVPLAQSHLQAASLGLALLQKLAFVALTQDSMRLSLVILIFFLLRHFVIIFLLRIFSGLRCLLIVGFKNSTFILVKIVVSLLLCSGVLGLCFIMVVELFHCAILDLILVLWQKDVLRL